MAKRKNYSPLRYPGGKSCLSNFITDIAQENDIIGGRYYELYAGGAGAALNLLFDRVFSSIHINDFDFKIFCIWDSILNNTEDFLRLVRDTPVTIDEWFRQKQIFEDGQQDNLHLGFATFFLNRTNRSGIIFKAGPIGGFDQTGNYKLDVRFNKDELIGRIVEIANVSDRIILTNEDALDIIENLSEYLPGPHVPSFIYMDPPYYKKGSKLYMNNYIHRNHELLEESISRNLNDVNWLISYDNVDEIRSIYEGYVMSSFDLNYTLQSKKFGSELLIFNNELRLPNKITVNSRATELILM